MPPDYLHSGHSRGHHRKSELRKLILDQNWDRIVAWAGDNSNALGTLSSLFFETDRLVLWRAIDALGRIAAVSAASNIEKIRGFVRRLFWLMNDESGGISWHAPEAIAEIIGAVPGLIGEFGEMYLAFLVEEPFEAGTCWGIARLRELNRLSIDLEKGVLARSQVIRDYLAADNARLRGYSVLAAARMGISVTPDVMARLQTDRREIEIYNFESGELQLMAIGRLAESLSVS
jgi:hypothetical protein